MLAVLGSGEQALLAATYAAHVSGEQVACEHKPPHGSDPTVFSVKMPDGVQSSATIVPLRDETMPRVHCVLIVAEARELPAVCRRWAPLLSGRPTLVAPGNFAGAIRVIKQFEAVSLPPPIVGEVPGFPVIGDVRGGSVAFRGVKGSLACGYISQGEANLAQETFADYLPGLVATSHLYTSLSNTNNLIHPPIVLANLSAISRGEPLRFYREAISPAASSLLQAVDRERLLLMDTLGLQPVTLEELMLSYYADTGMRGASIGSMLSSFVGFEHSMAPATLAHRYILDDVRHGLAGLAALGSISQVPVPTLGAIVDIFSAVTGRDLRTGAFEDAHAILATLREGESVRQ